MASVLIIRVGSTHTHLYIYTEKFINPSHDQFLATPLHTSFSKISQPINSFDTSSGFSKDLNYSPLSYFENGIGYKLFSLILCMGYFYED